MNTGKLQILQFKLDNMVSDPAIVMIAKRGSGKSYIVRDIMYHYRHIPGGVVIAPTDRVNPFYRMFFPDLYIHYDIKEIILIPCFILLFCFSCIRICLDITFFKIISFMS